MLRCCKRFLHCHANSRRPLLRPPGRPPSRCRIGTGYVRTPVSITQHQPRDWYVAQVHTSSTAPVSDARGDYPVQLVLARHSTIDSIVLYHDPRIRPREYGACSRHEQLFTCHCLFLIPGYHVRVRKWKNLLGSRYEHSSSLSAALLVSQHSISSPTHARGGRLWLFFYVVVVLPGW